MKAMFNHFCEKPRTSLGWWAFWLMIVFVIMFLINSFVFMPSTSDAAWRHILLPFYGILMLVCGLCSGVAGLTAVIRWQENSWLVWLTLLPGTFVVFLLLGELLFPH